MNRDTVKSCFSFLVRGGLMLAVALSVYRFNAYLAACRGDSTAANNARSLSQERLARLYADVLRLKQDDAQRRERDGSSASQLPYQILKEDPNFPEELRDLDCFRFDVNSPILILRHCHDHGLFLKFFGEGFGPSWEFTRPTIALQYGEGQSSTEEILWHAPFP